jgi:type III secretion system chaperone SycN
VGSSKASTVFPIRSSAFSYPHRKITSAQVGTPSNIMLTQLRPVMLQFSPRARTTVEGFSESLALPAIPARDGSYSFEFQRSGTLTITSATDGRAIVSLARRPERIDGALLKRFFLAAGIDATTNLALHAGLSKDGSLIYSVDFAVDDFTVPALHACLHNLIAAHDALG